MLRSIVNERTFATRVSRDQRSDNGSFEERGAFFSRRFDRNDGSEPLEPTEWTPAHSSGSGALFRDAKRSGMLQKTDVNPPALGLRARDHIIEISF